MVSYNLAQICIVTPISIICFLIFFTGLLYMEAKHFSLKVGRETFDEKTHYLLLRAQNNQYLTFQIQILHIDRVFNVHLEFLKKISKYQF